jgi:2-polyprenyl-3-methyl-5-hydroxy-6-metoxy-1,4-benzoquinol methylase
MNQKTRANDIAEFLGLNKTHAYDRILKGFHYNHALVADDFRNANVDINNPESLLNWYRITDAYIWELSAYHLESGFNYVGMCDGIRNHLLGSTKESVLILGDGVGDLSLVLAQAGLDVTYHDLEDSLTAKFAKHNFKACGYEDKISYHYTKGWSPTMPSKQHDAVIAVDFFEHLVNVEEWANAVFGALTSEGFFLAQNAFAIGDAEHGDSIPMHLSVNNRYVDDWDPLLESIGFINLQNGWWQKP